MILFYFPQFNYLANQLLKLPFLREGEFSALRYANNEAYIKVKTPVRDEHCAILGSIAPPDGNMLNFLLLAHTLKKEGAGRISALLPYLAYARHDKDKPGESLAAAAIGRLLKAAGVNEILTVDAHSRRSQKLLKLPVASILPAPTFAREIKDFGLRDITLIAPDNGAVSRCEAVLGELGGGLKIAAFEKRRTKTGVTHKPPKGRVKHTAVIIDDMLDTGGTLASACQYLRDMKVKDIYVFVSHGLFTGTRWKRLWGLRVKTVFCLNTVPGSIRHQSKKITILSAAPLLMDLLKQRAGRMPDGPANGNIGIGTDTGEFGLTEEAAAVYPAPESRRFGVRTDKTTSPTETDQGDEQYEGVLYGTPDDLSDKYGEEQTDRYIDKPYIG